MNAPLAQLILYKLMERSDTLTLGTLIYFRHFRHFRLPGNWTTNP